MAREIEEPATMVNRRILISGLASYSVSAAFPARASTKQKFHVYMVLYRGWEEACSGFRDYLLSHDLDIHFTVRDIKQDLANIPSTIVDVRAQKPDLLFVWGTSTAISMLGPWDSPDPTRYITEIPSVFCIVTDPVGNRIVKSKVDTGRLATGVEYIAPLEAQLQAMRFYRPFHSVAVVHNPKEANSVSVVRELSRLSTKFNYTTHIFPLDVNANPSDSYGIAKKIDEAKETGVDWLYIPPDTLLNEIRHAYTSAANALKIPTFTATERYVRFSDGLAGLVSRYSSVGAFAGYKAQQILTGTKLVTDIPVESLTRFSYLIKLDTAHSLQCYPPIKLLKMAEVI